MVSSKDVPEFVGQIIDIFEDFLADRDIILDNDEREQAIYEGQDPGEVAIIYGTDYGELQTALEAMLINWNIIKERYYES